MKSKEFKIIFDKETEKYKILHGNSYYNEKHQTWVMPHEAGYMYPLDIPVELV